MKNFFKSFVIFMCATLMLGACTDEQVEDAGVGLVSLPTIESIEAGNQRVLLSFFIDESNVDVTSAIIAWSNDDETVAGSVSVSVEPGVCKTYEIKGNGVDVADLTPGNYTFGVVSVAPNGVSNPATATISVYGESTYANSVLSIVSAAVSQSDTDDLVITWGTVSADCKSVYISYVDADGTPMFYDETEISTGLQTTLEDGNTPQTIIYSTTFLPTDGLDEVEITGGQYIIESEVTSPVITDAKVGKNRFEVTWTTPADISEIAYYVVVFGNNSRYLWLDMADVPAEATYQTESYDSPNTSYTTIIPDVATGDYALSIYSVSKSDLNSTAEEFGEGMITIYDDDSYGVPAITEITNQVGEVTITFESLNVDCKALVVNYFTTTDTTDATGVAEVTIADPATITLTDAHEGSEIEVVATYYPESVINATEDAVEKSAIDVLTVPYVSLTTPTLSEAYLSDYVVDGASTITISWAAADGEADFVDEYIVTYDDYAVTVAGTETSCTLSTADATDPIAVGTEYAISVVAVNNIGVASEVSNQIVASTYNESTYAGVVVDPSVKVDTDTGLVTATWNLVDDLKSVKLVYDGKSYIVDVVDLSNDAETISLSFTYSSVVTFDYSMSFCPANGTTEVVLGGDYEIDTDALALNYPTNVVAVAGVDDNGNSVIYLTWNTIEVTATPYVTGVFDEDTALTATEQADGSYSATISGVDSKTEYTVSLYMKAEESGLTSAAVSANKVTTYSSVDDIVLAD